MEIFIHLGYPKTGSTYLQQQVFPLIKDINYIGKPFKKEELSKIFIDIIQLNDDEFIKKRGQIIDEIENYFAKSNFKKVLLSYEDFMVATILNTKEIPETNQIFKTLNRTNEIFSTFGKVNFFFCIRNYIEMLEKNLNQFVPYFNFQYSYKDFYMNLNGEKKNNFILKNFFYGEIYNFIKAISKNSKIFLYEDLKKDYKFFIKELLRYLEVDQNIEEIKIKNVKINPSKSFIYWFKLYFKNILINPKKILKYENYMGMFKQIKYIFNRKRKTFSVKKDKQLILKFYSPDFKLLPEETKTKCINYGYFD